jgi:hypothetical protein
MRLPLGVDGTVFFCRGNPEKTWELRAVFWRNKFFIFQEKSR